MVPSTQATIYVKGTAAANADGSLAIAAFPNAKGFFQYANGGAAVAFTGGGAADAADQSAIASNFSMGRIISIGIKAIPSIAATSAPGFSYSGAIEGSNVTLFQALTPNDLASFPTSIQGIASVGARAVGRPQDTNSFAFSTAVTNATGFTSTTAFPTSIPYIAFLGLPASAVVGYELVANVELLEITQHSSAGVGMSKGIGETLASYWPSFEKLWSYIQPALPPPGKAQLSLTEGGSSLMSMAAQFVMGGKSNDLFSLPGRLKAIAL
jgi:hypothetical protein